MIRFLVALLLGWIIGVISDRFFPSSLPQAPAVVQTAAASLGIKPSPASSAPAYTPTGPLSTSITAEMNKNYDEALKAVAVYQRSGGDAFLALERTGWLYYLKGVYPQAEQAYLEANRQHPSALTPLLGLLNIAQAMKDEARIQRAADALLRIDPMNYRANMLLAGRAFAAKDYRGAAFYYRKVLNAYPDDSDARSGLGWAEFYTGDKHDALVQFQGILATYPDYPYAKQGYKLLTGTK